MFALNSEAARKIKLLVLDVDGIMSNGKLLFASDGTELKAFHILDGLGIKLLQESGVDVAIITGRKSAMVDRRARDLGIRHLTQGREDKLTALKELTGQLGLSLDEVAYMGDDLPDLAAIRAVGIGITVPNAHNIVKKHAGFCTRTAGGDGAVREVCDLLMVAQGTMPSVVEGYL